jgi:prepilin-type processing-associated H-X9-DG protein
MPARTRSAFTVTELLVVIALIVLLLSLMLVALGKVAGLSRSSVCGSNQRQIGVSLIAYTTDYEGHIFDWRNWGKWLNPADQSQIIDPNHGQAYWGVIYATYVGGGPELFHCPEAIRIDPDQADLEALQGKPCNCYGINGYAIWSPYTDTFRQEHFGAPNKIALYENKNGHWLGRSVFHMPHASKTLFCHDAYETMLDGNGDTLDNWYQYDDYSMDDRDGEQIKNDEYLRHNGLCNCIWMDGHISSESEEEWDREWYLGRMNYTGP